MNIPKVVFIAFAAFIVTIIFIVLAFGRGNKAENSQIKSSPLSILSTKSYSIALEKPGCATLDCVVTTRSEITVNSNGDVVETFTKSDGINPTTKYDVFVCTPNCGTGKAAEGWGRKSCTSTEASTLTVDLATNSCY